MSKHICKNPFYLILFYSLSICISDYSKTTDERLVKHDVYSLFVSKSRFVFYSSTLLHNCVSYYLNTRYTYKFCINLCINQEVFKCRLIVTRAFNKAKDLQVRLLSTHYCCVVSFFIELYASPICWITMKGYQILISYKQLYTI